MPAIQVHTKSTPYPILYILYSCSQLTHPFVHTADMHGKLPTYLALSSSTAIDSAEIVKYGYKVLPAINYKDFTLTLGHAKFDIAQYRRSRFLFYLPSNYGGVKKSWTINALLKLL